MASQYCEERRTNEFLFTQLVEEEVEQHEHGAHENDEDEDKDRRNSQRNLFLLPITSDVGLVANPFFVVVASIVADDRGLGSLELRLATKRKKIRIKVGVLEADSSNGRQA